MESADKEKIAEAINRIAPQFFAEGHEKVYVALCCDRVLVTLKEPKTCRTCGNKPEGLWVDPDNLHTLKG